MAKSNTINTGSTRKALVFGGMLLLITVWLVFKYYLWNNYTSFSPSFPKISYLQKFQAMLSGNPGSLQLYAISLGLPAAIFLMLVLIPKVLSRLFPKYRVWNIGYIAASGVLILVMALLMPSVTKLYRNGAFFKALFRGVPSVYLKPITALNIHITTVLFFLIVIFSLVLLVLEILRKKPEGGLRVTRRVGTTLLLCLLMAFTISISSLLLLNVVSLFSKSAVSSVYNFCVKNATFPMSAFVNLVCAPIMEEIAFRGVMCRGLNKTSHRWAAILISAVAFGLWHRNPGQFAYTFVWGILYGYLYLCTDRLCYPMLIHFASNLISILAHSDKSSCVFGQWSALCAFRQWLLELPVVVSILFLAVFVAATVYCLRYIRNTHDSQ